MIAFSVTIVGFHWSLALNIFAYVSLSETLTEFKKFVLDDPETVKSIKALREKVINFSSGFSMPGYDDH